MAEGSESKRPPPSSLYLALEKSELLKNFTPTGLRILSSIAIEKTLPPDTPLFVENMVGEGLFIVAEGRIRLEMAGVDGSLVPLGELGPGQSLGEAALLRAGPRLCTATAVVETKVVELMRRDIGHLQRTKPQACLKLFMGVVALLGDRIQNAGGDLKTFATWKAQGL